MYVPDIFMAYEVENISQETSVFLTLLLLKNFTYPVI